MNMINVLGAQKFICVTCDVWSSRASSFLGMTVHFITKEFEPQSYALAFRKSKGRQTYLELASEIDKILCEFNL